MTGERIVRAYNPKKILDYFQFRGYITIRDLRKVLGYERRLSSFIIMDMIDMGLIKGDVYRIVEGEGPNEKYPNMSYKCYILTKVGEAVKDYELKERIVHLVRFPLFDKALKDILNNELNGKDTTLKEVTKDWNPVDLVRLEEDIENIKRMPGKK